MQYTSQPTYPETLRRESFPACGRLIVLQNITQAVMENLIMAHENFTGFTSINFPAMPDAIDLARRAEYVTPAAYGMPDGMPVYKSTSMLKIPFSFKLHYADIEYCVKGAKTLLEVAGLLHALVVPFGPEYVPTTWGAMVEDYVKEKQKEAKEGQQNDSQVKYMASEPTYNLTPPPDIFPPATCLLELIRTEFDSVGIACIGYIEEVRARLLGPWMRSHVPGSQNLPTACEYEFTFVHHPGHGNAFRTNSRVQEQQAYAKTVKERLYNTVALITNTNYRGFSDQPPPLPQQIKIGGEPSQPGQQPGPVISSDLTPEQQQIIRDTFGKAAQDAKESGLTPSGGAPNEQGIVNDFPGASP